MLIFHGLYYPVVTSSRPLLRDARAGQEWSVEASIRLLAPGAAAAPVRTLGCAAAHAVCGESTNAVLRFDYYPVVTLQRTDGQLGDLRLGGIERTFLEQITSGLLFVKRIL